MNDREKQTAQDRWPRQQGASRATGTFYASNPTSSSMVGLVRKDQALYSKDYCAERRTCHLPRYAMADNPLPGTDFRWMAHSCLRERSKGSWL